MNAAAGSKSFHGLMARRGRQERTESSERTRRYRAWWVPPHHFLQGSTSQAASDPEQASADGTSSPQTLLKQEKLSLSVKSKDSSRSMLHHLHLVEEQQKIPAVTRWILTGGDGVHQSLILVTTAIGLLPSIGIKHRGRVKECQGGMTS